MSLRTLIFEWPGWKPTFLSHLTQRIKVIGIVKVPGEWEGQKKVCWLSADLSILHNSDIFPFLQCVWFFRTEEKCRNPTGGREKICTTCQHFIVLINEYKPGVIVNMHVYVILEKWENLRLNH